MRDASARLQHEAHDTANWDVYPHPNLVHQHEGAVKHIQPSFFKEQNRGPFFYRDRTGWRQPAQDASHALARRINIRPQPNALAAPNPLSTFARKRSGASTVSTPWKIRVEKVMGRLPSRGMRTCS